MRNILISLTCVLTLAACASEQAPVPAKVSYNCEGHLVDVNNVTDTAVLKRAGKDMLLVRTPSEDGVKFAPKDPSRKKPVLLTKGAATTLTIGKKALACAVK